MINLKFYRLTMHRKQDKKITFAQKYVINSYSINGIYMKYIKNYVPLFHCYIALIAMLFVAPVFAQDTKFTVVIDAGHGGHDPGAQGAISKEKDINLAISLALGSIIEQKFKDVKVVFSRKTDKYLTLQERADVVNDHHADLFICVHTNASPSSAAYGAESFTLGLAKSKANLDVAMRENSVITMEENYKAKYQGFDPSSVDSYIMFEFMQDKYIDRSVDFASTIQKQFKNYCNRSDRGVRQAGFWVLHRSACPSVLVEVGFISNPAEERYLNSEAGQREMASGIFNAFVDYKRNHDRRSGHQLTMVSKMEPSARQQESTTVQTKQESKLQVQDTTVPEPNVAVVQNKRTSVQQIFKASSAQELRKDTDLSKVIKPELDKNKQNNTTVPVFKVQLLASAKALKLTDSDLKNVRNISSFIESGLNKYTIGAETDYTKIEKIRKEILPKFPNAFIIAFVGDKKMSAKEGLKLIK
jgi:N-acetylmuramoyl-L-alanine amidase